MNQNSVILIQHPLIQHKLSIMRDKQTSSMKFRALMHEISLLLTYELTRDLELEYVNIETPITSYQAPQLKEKNWIFVSILRAGNGLLDGMLQLLPKARIGHIGLYRDPMTFEPVEYYLKLPEMTEGSDVIVVDPMLATGNSALAAIHELKNFKPNSIKFLCLLAAPEGIAVLQEEHPDVPIYTAAIDTCLDEHGYIVPGLGDAGDRLFGTR